MQPWRELQQTGRSYPLRRKWVAIGHTPPEVLLAWFNDALDVMGELHAGFALWNFRGPCGVLDTERPGTKSEDWEGHKLDRPLLALLQKDEGVTTRLACCCIESKLRRRGELQGPTS